MLTASAIKKLGKDREVRVSADFLPEFNKLVEQYANRLMDLAVENARRDKVGTVKDRHLQEVATYGEE